MSRLFNLTIAGSLALVLGTEARATDAASNSIWTQPRLLEGGWRQELTDNGINIDAWLTQFYQGSASGGSTGEWQYGSKGDIFVTLDSAKLGLWQGLSIAAHAELLYGEDANAFGNGGILLPADTALAFPRLGGSDQDLSVVVTQAFNERISVSFGKFNMLDVIAKTPLLGGGGTDTFMNTALAAPITGVTPPYLVGANITVKTDPVIFTGFVYDPRNAQNENVLRDPFSEGITGMLSATLPYQLSGRSGFLGAKVIYSNKEGTNLSEVPNLVLPGGSNEFLGTKKGSWFVGASFQQYLVQSPANPLEGWGVFGQFGISDGNPNPIEWSALLGVGGTSFIPGRNLDRWGVGYFRYSLSSDLRDGLKTIALDLRDEQGIEAFYNLAVTPWFSVTGDLQVVQPVISAVSTEVTASLRTKIRF
ncbi:carbohydrate porin [Mesorhizobium sp. DCY119]|uniref:carbohydrate porin n=1 Tax=Mesorhizobium sp. DCY119 TaxID=2108445 RepID=UPI000E766861|nr:carbohydrate porin [Mesorhizobium sp. DCY119]RJG40620.1 porin [Mesorhizobium sp. DCY119]